VLADDHPVVREGLRRLLMSERDMEVVGEVADGEEACRAARELEPDVVIMDMSMPRLDGIEATKIVRRDCPTVHVLILTVHEERAYLTELLRAGATGFVLKRSAAAELVRAVRTVATGGTYIDPSIAGAVVEGYLGVQSDTHEPPPGDTLSDREREVLLRVATGYSNKEIAAQLALSVKTVESYKARAAEKLGLKTRVDIVRYAARQGWLDGEGEAPSR
jgi:DNA-binding NarL/FixJ family response regulator